MQKYVRKFKSLTPPLRWFSLFILGMLGLAFYFSPEAKAVDFTEISFQTSADSRLYFNNVRSYFYHIDTRSKSPAIIYRIKRRSPERDSLSVVFDIVHYPGAEDAFVFTTAGKGFGDSDSLFLAFENYPNNEILSGINGEGHYRIAAKTYSSLLDQGRVFLLSGSSDTLQELFTDKASRLDAETVLEDYFKLVLKN